MDAEAIGTGEMEDDDLAREFLAASKRLQVVVKTPPPATADPNADPDETAVETDRRVRQATAMWTANARVKGRPPQFKRNKPAMVEAWMLVRTENPTREFQIYWREDGVTLE